MQITFLTILFILGACFGSFLCCQARRLKLKETKHQKLGSRSVCLSCKKPIKWYDNLPIISWLVLGGKCRYCRKKIGSLEILSELGLALGFLAAGFSIDITSASVVEWAIFVLYLTLLLVLGFLAIYDGAYGELPTKFLVLAITIALVRTIVVLGCGFAEAGFSFMPILAVLLSVLILGGLYLVLYLVSKGAWVGDGDWLLATAIGISLITPWLSLIALFVANLLACLVMYPIVRHRKNKKIYFGPFLVIAFIITMTFGSLWGSVL